MPDGHWAWAWDSGTSHAPLPGQFGQVGGVAGSGFSADEDDLVLIQRRLDFLTAGADRLGFGQLDVQRCGHGAATIKAGFGSG